jgi:hypothetical protein
MKKTMAIDFLVYLAFIVAFYFWMVTVASASN